MNFENTPQISWPELRRRNKLVHATLLDAVRKALPSDCVDFVYSLARDCIIAWKKGEWTFCFQVNPYDEFAWRLTNRGFHYHKLPKRLNKRRVTEPNGAWCYAPAPEPLHDFELSFVGNETPLVATPDLVRFVESVFTTDKCADVYKWPLFSHHQSYPHYAWTREGGPVVLRKQRERAEREKRFLAKS
jgi:hypothetical protein